MILGQQGRLDEARQVIESLWDNTVVVPAGDVADRLIMLREYMGLDLERFPMEWNLSRIEGGIQSANDDDRNALSVSRAYVATQAGDFQRAGAELDACLARRPNDPVVWRARLEWAVSAGRLDLAREALGHVPASKIDDRRLWELRAWFVRQRSDDLAERRALEQLAQGPGRTGALGRLAELVRRAGETEAAAALRQRKDELDAAFDRYSRLYRDDRLVDHLPELASLAERLGRVFEARSFWEVVAAKDPTNPDATPALAPRKSGRGPGSGGGYPGRRSWRCALRPASAISRAESRGNGGQLSMPWFEDRSSAAGLAGFVQDNGVSPIHQLPEMSSGGVGLLDFDGDGFVDVYCVQGGRFPPEPGVPSPGDRLYRNQGNGTFEDVTVKSRIGACRADTAMGSRWGISTTTGVPTFSSRDGDRMGCTAIGATERLRTSPERRGWEAIATGRRRQPLPILMATATSISMCATTESGILRTRGFARTPPARLFSPATPA